MSHHHHSPHSHHSDLSGKRLFSAVLLNLIITVSELIGGIFSGSLSLLSDALHNLSDAFALVVSYVAHRISKKGNTSQYTYGYKRTEILAALFNATLLIVLSVFLLKEAVSRFYEPKGIDGKIMFFVALTGLFANVFSVFLLHRDSGKNMNIRAAYLHLLSDAFSSAGVVITGMVIYFYDVYFLDSFLTILISGYIIKETYGILFDAVGILMEKTPRNINPEDVKKKMETVSGVENIHHLHIWKLDEHRINFEAHIDLEVDVRISETGKLRGEIEQLLSEEFGITHVTIQFEYDTCKDKSLIHNTKE